MEQIKVCFTRRACRTTAITRTRANNLRLSRVRGEETRDELKEQLSPAKVVLKKLFQARLSNSE